MITFTMKLVEFFFQGYVFYLNPVNKITDKINRFFFSFKSEERVKKVIKKKHSE